ncbi:MAG: hypothetical protein GF349_02655 [Candidatus Magasanikbacteria bacterium]|nr:hypothetical protein [Candidatus Magasanikbacteria bacterium]
MFDIISIGDTTVDTIIVIDKASVNCDLKKSQCQLCINYADKIPISKSDLSIGGNAANIAVGCKKLGLKTALITELGSDVNGDYVKKELRKMKVNTDLTKNLKNKETRYSIVLNYRGERTILSYHAERNYTLPKIPKCKWIYFTSMSKNYEKIVPKLLNFLEKNKEIKLAFNPGSYQMKNSMTEIKKILKQTDLLFVNKQEAKKITGKDEKIKKLFPYLHKKGVKTAVITDGTKGSYSSHENEIFFTPASKEKAKAKTGAGDAYASGFLSAIVYGKSIPEAMKWGTANASGVITEFGAQKGLLSKNGIQKQIKKL